MVQTQVRSETSMTDALHRALVAVADRDDRAAGVMPLAWYVVAETATYVSAHRIPGPDASAAAFDSVVGTSLRAALATAAVTFETSGDTPADSDDRLRHVVSEWVHGEVPLVSALALIDRGFDLVLDALAGREPCPSRLTADVKTLADIRAAVTTTVVGVFATSAVGDVPGSARREFISALLAGRAEIDRAPDVGIVPSARYQVVALTVRSADDAVRRPSVVRLETAVREVLGPDVLALLSDAGGTMLLPTRAGGDGMRESTIASLVDIMGTPVLAAAVEGPVADVAAMAHHADELLDLADSIGKPSGVYTLEDLAVEYLLTRPSAAYDGLAAMIEPLKCNVELLQTLRVHMACGMNRRETARTLSVHPNTVDNRMMRVSAALGLDLRHPKAIAQTQSAILAFDALRRPGNRRPLPAPA